MSLSPIIAERNRAAVELGEMFQPAAGSDEDWSLSYAADLPEKEAQRHGHFGQVLSRLKEIGELHGETNFAAAIESAINAIGS